MKSSCKHSMRGGSCWFTFCKWPFSLTGLLLATCTGGPSNKNDHRAIDTMDIPFPSSSQVLLIDTLRGTIGDGTTMHVVELISVHSSDTSLLDVTDDTTIDANLQVGNYVQAIVCCETDGSQTLITVTDTTP